MCNFHILFMIRLFSGIINKTTKRQYLFPAVGCIYICYCRSSGKRGSTTINLPPLSRLQTHFMKLDGFRRYFHQSSLTHRNFIVYPVVGHRSPAKCVAKTGNGRGVSKAGTMINIDNTQRFGEFMEKIVFLIIAHGAAQPGKTC